MPYELSVDPITCEGHGVCFDLAPDLLAPDDWGFPILLHPNVPRELLSQARRATSACPQLALRLRLHRRVPMPRRRAPAPH